MFQKCLINEPSKKEKYLQEYLHIIPDIQRKILKNCSRKRKHTPHPTRLQGFFGESPVWMDKMQVINDSSLSRNPCRSQHLKTVPVKLKFTFSCETSFSNRLRGL